MARFVTDGLDAIIDDMNRLGESSGETAQRMLLAGAAVVREAWREAAEAHDHRVTRDMIESIGYPREPKTAGDVMWIDIYPQGRDRKGIRNAEKAFILHYGSRKLPASRWVDDADARSSETVVPAMATIWDEFLQNQT